MARRGRKASGAEGLALIVVLAILFVVIPAILTAATYGGPLFVFGGLIYCKSRGGRPKRVQGFADFYSVAEHSTLFL